MDKWFEENIEEIIKKFNEYGVDMKIRNNKRKSGFVFLFCGGIPCLVVCFGGFGYSLLSVDSLL